MDESILKANAKLGQGPASGGAISAPAPIKLIAIDLDGTLLSSRKTILPRTHTVLKTVIGKGVKVVLASARPPRSVRSYYRALHLSTPSIHYNGALVWDEPHKKVLSHTPVDPGLARRVIEAARKRYPEILVSIEILDKWYTDHYADIPEYRTETAKHFTPDFVGPLDAFLRVPATKVMLLGKPEWIEDLESRLAESFPKQVAHTRSDPFLLQVMAAGVSKGVALQKLAARLHVAREAVLAIGDAPNDAEMLQWAGVSVAMANGWEETRRQATWVAPSNDDDGVAAALERYVLGERVVTRAKAGSPFASK